MAWELQRHMHAWVAPSIEAYARAQDDQAGWLASIYADQRWDEATGQAGYDALLSDALGYVRDGMTDFLVGEIADWAIDENATTNGGHEVYLDDHTSVPWCDEEFYHQWWANQ